MPPKKKINPSTSQVDRAPAEQDSAGYLRDVQLASDFMSIVLGGSVATLKTFVASNWAPSSSSSSSLESATVDAPPTVAKRRRVESAGAAARCGCDDGGADSVPIDASPTAPLFIAMALSNFCDGPVPPTPSPVATFPAHFTKLGRSLVFRLVLRGIHEDLTGASSSPSPSGGSAGCGNTASEGGAVSMLTYLMETFGDVALFTRKEVVAVPCTPAAPASNADCPLLLPIVTFRDLLNTPSCAEFNRTPLMRAILGTAVSSTSTPVTCARMVRALLSLGADPNLGCMPIPPAFGSFRPPRRGASAKALSSNSLLPYRGPPVADVKLFLPCREATAAAPASGAGGSTENGQPPSATTSAASPAAAATDLATERANDEGTPMLQAIIKGDREAVALLLQHGAANTDAYTVRGFIEDCAAAAVVGGCSGVCWEAEVPLEKRPPPLLSTEGVVSGAARNGGFVLDLSPRSFTTSSPLSASAMPMRLFWYDHPREKSPSINRYWFMTRRLLPNYCHRMAPLALAARIATDYETIDAQPQTTGKSSPYQYLPPAAAICQLLMDLGCDPDGREEELGPFPLFSCLGAGSLAHAEGRRWYTASYRSDSQLNPLPLGRGDFAVTPAINAFFEKDRLLLGGGGAAGNGVGSSTILLGGGRGGLVAGGGGGGGTTAATGGGGGTAAVERLPAEVFFGLRGGGMYQAPEALAIVVRSPLALFLAEGADLTHARGEYGLPLLHAAAVGGDATAMRAILKAVTTRGGGACGVCGGLYRQQVVDGTSPLGRNRHVSGMTPLALAAKYGHLACCRLLVEGASGGGRGGRGECNVLAMCDYMLASSWAEVTRHGECAAYLKRAEAQALAELRGVQ